MKTIRNWLTRTSLNEKTGQLVAFAGLWFMAAVMYKQAPGDHSWVMYSLATFFAVIPFVVFYVKYRK